MADNDGPITFEQATDLILEVYNDWSDDDPDWWDAMQDSIREFGTIEDARG